VFYEFTTVQRPDRQPFPVEFANGPAQGVLNLSQPIEYAPEEFAVPLNNKMKPLEDEATIAAVAVYERRQSHGRWRYHFLRTETSGPLLEHVRSQTGKSRLKQAVDAFYQHPLDAIYSVKPKGEHPQVFVQVGHRMGNVDEKVAPLIRELWRLGFDTIGSCQAGRTGKGYLGFPFAPQGNAFHKILSDAGLYSVAEQKTVSIGRRSSLNASPEDKMIFESVNVSFASDDIGRIVDLLRALKRPNA